MAKYYQFVRGDLYAKSVFCDGRVRTTRRPENGRLFTRSRAREVYDKIRSHGWRPVKFEL